MIFPYALGWRISSETPVALCRPPDRVRGGCGLRPDHSAWVDIAATGQDVGLSATDDGGVLIPIGFTFPFYAGEYVMVGVSSNGYLAFGTQLGAAGNTALPDPAAPRPDRSVI